MSDALSRRHFLTAAAAMAAAGSIAFDPSKLTAAPLVADTDYKYVPDPALPKIKLGIIGVGGRGNALLSEILKSQQAEVVAICDIRPEAVAAAQARCVGMKPDAIVDYKDLLGREDIQAVVIATPVDEHREMALAALKTGKNIYCEKPLGLSYKQARDIYEAAKDYEKVFQVGFQWVYNRQFRSAINAVQAGAIGGVRFIHAQRHGGDLPRDKGKTWLFERERSGDIIVEQAVHEMNIFCWGMNAHPVKANGFGGTNLYVNQPPARSIMDHYSLSMEFPGPCHMSYSHLYYAGALASTHIYFYGDKGVVDVMNGKIMVEKGTEPPAPAELKLTDEDTFNAFLSFFDKCRNGGQADADAHKGLLATQTAVLGRAAIYRGATVTWEELKAVDAQIMDTELKKQS